MGVEVEDEDALHVSGPPRAPARGGIDPGIPPRDGGPGYRKRWRLPAAPMPQAPRTPRRGPPRERPRKAALRPASPPRGGSRSGRLPRERDRSWGGRQDWTAPPASLLRRRRRRSPPRSARRAKDP